VNFYNVNLLILIAWNLYVWGFIIFLEGLGPEWHMLILICGFLNRFQNSSCLLFMSVIVSRFISLPVIRS